MDPSGTTAMIYLYQAANALTATICNILDDDDDDVVKWRELNQSNE